MSGSTARQEDRDEVELSPDLLPIMPYIERDTAGAPVLVGTRCGVCSEMTLGTRAVCQACGARSDLERIELRTTGRLYNYTVVHRSLPGIPVPFIFAVIDLDGGGVVKGNLAAPLDAVRFDMPVRVVFERAPRPDAKGREYLSYHFVAA